MNIKTSTVGSPWRTVLLVIVVAVADVLMSVIVVGLAIDAGTIPEPETAGLEWARYGFAPLVALLGAVALIWRQRFPRATAGAAALLGGLSFSGVAFFVALFLLAKRRLDWWVAGAIALSISAEALVGIEPLGWDGALLVLFLLGAIAGWGAYRGQRARLRDSLMNSLKERAERAEAERVAETDRTKLAERHRIAREMHDTLAHRMSLVAVQAASLQVDAPDVETAAAAEMIRETAHAALEELRDVLGVLHGDGGPGTAPGAGTTMPGQARLSPPGIAQIEGLVAEWRQAGIAVDHGANLAPADVDAIPDAAGRAAYRVVQEGITNAARHAPGSTAVVWLELQEAESGDCSLRVMVDNGPGIGDQAALGAGLGLVGLAERIELLGGRLEHGFVGAGYQLLVEIPFERLDRSGVPA